MKSALYEGVVTHRRRAPVGNAFRYRLFHVYLDLAELDTVFRGRWLWSAKGPALAWFRREDHFGDPAAPLDEAVRDLVEQRLGRRPRGAVRLLTHLRYFGYVMNPVSFFYCFDPDDECLEAVVAEVHNTPWGERHCYVLDADGEPADGGMRAFAFAKDFHVSPFMPMEQSYRWRIGDPGERLAVAMENFEGEEKVFDAALALERREITGASLARSLALFPWMTAKVIAAIYWQAFRLWLKGVRFHPHPKHGADAREAQTT